MFFGMKSKNLKLHLKSTCNYLREGELDSAYFFHGVEWRPKKFVIKKDGASRLAIVGAAADSCVTPSSHSDLLPRCCSPTCIFDETSSMPAMLLIP